MSDHALIILRTLSQLDPPVDRKMLYSRVFFTHRTISDHLAHLEQEGLIHIGGRRGPIWLTIRGEDLING